MPHLANQVARETREPAVSSARLLEGQVSQEMPQPVEVAGLNALRIDGSGYGMDVENESLTSRRLGSAMSSA